MLAKADKWLTDLLRCGLSPAAVQAFRGLLRKCWTFPSSCSAAAAAGILKAAGVTCGSVAFSQLWRPSVHTPAFHAHQSPYEVWTIIIHCFVGRKKKATRRINSMPQNKPGQQQETTPPRELAGVLLQSHSLVSDACLAHGSVVLKLECASESPGTLDAPQATVYHPQAF